MFKKFIFTISMIIIISYYSFSITPTEVSTKPEVYQKKEIGIFPVFTTYSLMNNAAPYFDNKLIELFSKMKRFQVIGYQYRLDFKSAEAFIKKIQDLKKEAVMSDKKYVDEDLGVVVISAEDMKKLVNSFFIIIPSITGYSTSTYQAPKKDGDSVTYVTKYKAEISISIKIITSEGKLLDTYNSTTTKESEDSYFKAYTGAVNDALSGLEFFLRGVEEFKIKTQVLDISGGNVMFQLGKDVGIQPGYEFFIEKTKIIMGFTNKEYVGLLRTKDVKDQYSFASIIFGNPMVGDQLVEARMLGTRFNLMAGMFPMFILTTTLYITFYDYSPAPDYFTNTININSSSYVFGIGLNSEYEIDYSMLANLNMGVLINNPLGFYLDIGGSYELYFGFVSLTIGADLSASGLWIDLGQLDLTTGYIQIQTNTYYNDVNMTLFGANIGIKPKATFNIQFSQGFKLRLTAGYGLFFLPLYWVSFTGTGDDSDKSSLLDLSDSHFGVLVNGTRRNTLPIDYNGVFGGIELVFRF